MTPRRLDVGALGAKLRAMRRLLDELDRIGAVDVDRFARDFRTQLVVDRIVSQLVDLALGGRPERVTAFRRATVAR